jgi:triosephosphate isomerase
MKAIVVANWKMNPTTFREAKRLLEATRKAAEGTKATLIVAPPSIYLRELRASYKGARISFAAQNVFATPAGAYTGETSFAQVKDARAQYAIVGHSERRALGESNEEAGQKVAAVLGAGMTPILCIGEKQRGASGEHFTFVREQLRAGLSGVPAQKIGRIIVAYEPVWAIGGEQAMAPRQMHEMAIFIRKQLVESHGEKAMDIRILYGGSVNEESARAMLGEGDVSGLLVGHVSIEPARFAALLRSLQ